MRNRFDEQLERLNDEMKDMGVLCENAIIISIKGLLENDDVLLEKVSAIEEEIDQREKEIESICMKLLIQQQPVARDLRVISSALKMITDMERIGDQAEDIAEIAKYLKGKDIKHKVHLKDMADAASRMVTDSIDSFVKKDIVLALEVVKSDDVVDDLFEKIKQELIDLIAEDKSNGEMCIDILMIAKYLERIGDHATNIGEWVEYMITGVHNNYN